MAIRARVQRARGDIDGSIATTREAIAQRIALSGHDNRETALLFNSLAIALATVNRLPEALKANYETTAIYRALGLGDGLDAQIIVANTGTLEMRDGHLREAEALLKSSVERERALAGDSAAVAAAMSYYGRILSITNRNEPGNQHAAAIGGHRGPLRRTRQSGRASGADILGRSAVGSGNQSEASGMLKEAYQDSLAHYGAAHPLTLRAEIAVGQLAASEGNYPRRSGSLPRPARDCANSARKARPRLAMALEELGGGRIRARPQCGRGDGAAASGFDSRRDARRYLGTGAGPGTVGRGSGEKRQRRSAGAVEKGEHRFGIPARRRSSANFAGQSRAGALALKRFGTIAF